MLTIYPFFKAVFRVPILFLKAVLRVFFVGRSKGDVVRYSNRIVGSLHVSPNLFSINWLAWDFNCQAGYSGLEPRGCSSLLLRSHAKPIPLVTNRGFSTFLFWTPPKYEPFLLKEPFLGALFQELYRKNGPKKGSLKKKGPYGLLLNSSVWESSGPLCFSDNLLLQGCF